MGSTQFGNFHDFCRDSTLPVCNLFNVNQPPGSHYGGCVLEGIGLSGGRNLANLGSILIAFVAILVSIGLLWLSDRKHAAVGRREIQIFLLGFIVIEICEIFSVGGIPLDDNVRKGFSAVHIAAITATSWILLLNALVGFQLIDDGTPASIGLISASAIALFIGTGYIALDTAFSWTGHFDSSLTGNNRNIGLYVLYQLFPLICLVLFFLLETVLVLRVLGELRPMFYLAGAGLLFAIGQIFQYVISTHLCQATSGKINGALFETLFTLLSVVGVWGFWSSITEDDWPLPVGSGYN
ncbi:Putative Chitin synthase [Penicillium brasilianum]|uniref:Putative Chitin synthase n=1 Tax=Penicillium brasilianum TaxID=104259 RepID=A0A0F7TFF8_PENBI|nr:Putative Chitin synthase [Penicillium brasilianum]